MSEFFWTTQEAARETHYTVRWIRQLCREGIISYRRRGRQYELLPESVMHYKNSYKHPGGRGKKKH
jgi:hypothetical protein